MAHRRKLAILAIFLNSKHQKSYQGTLGTQELPLTGSMPSLVLHGALQGPLKGPCDFSDSARLCLPFLKNTFSKPSEHHGTRLWSVLYLTLRIKGPPRSKLIDFLIHLKKMDKLKNTAWFEVNRISDCRAIII